MIVEIPNKSRFDWLDPIILAGATSNTQCFCSLQSFRSSASIHVNIQNIYSLFVPSLSFNLHDRKHTGLIEVNIRKILV